MPNAILFGCGCCNRTGNMGYSVTGNAWFGYFSPAPVLMNPPIVTAFDTPVQWAPFNIQYLQATETITYQDGVTVQVVFTFNAYTASLACNYPNLPTWTGPSTPITTLAACTYGGPRLTHDFTLNCEHVIAVIPERKWGSEAPAGTSPDTAIPYVQTETLGLPYTYQEAVQHAYALLDRVALLAPGQLYTDSQSGLQFQVGYPTDPIAPGSAGVYQSVGVYDPDTDVVSVGWPVTPAFNRVSGLITVGPPLVLGGPTVYGGQAVQLLGMMGTANSGGGPVCSKGVVFLVSPFGEQYSVDDLPPTIMITQAAGEYIYTPNPGDLGRTYQRTSPPAPPLPVYSFSRYTLTIPPTPA